jgi:hypothetical protein
MQTKQELEHWYTDSDPWNYQQDPEDTYRKNFYMAVLEDVGPVFSKALDIGAGEGWITKDLPAIEKHAFEISDTAATRLPDGVERVTKISGKYDLVTATGVLYEQYNHPAMANLIHSVSAKSCDTIIMIAGIKDWIQPYTFGKQIRHFEIPYREYVHIIDIWEYE